MEGLEQASVFLAAVSLFLSCLMPTVLSADLCIPRLFLIALLGERVWFTSWSSPFLLYPNLCA